jgi:transposase-like protein
MKGAQKVLAGPVASGRMTVSIGELIKNTESGAILQQQTPETDVTPKEGDESVTVMSKEREELADGMVLRRKFDEEFKRNVVKQSYASLDGSAKVKELGVGSSLLAQWRKRYATEDDRTRYAALKNEASTDAGRKGSVAAKRSKAAAKVIASPGGGQAKRAGRRRKFDEAFKRNAVKRSCEGTESVAEIVEALGINVGMLYQWRKRYGGIDAPLAPQELAAPAPESAEAAAAAPIRGRRRRKSSTGPDGTAAAGTLSESPGAPDSETAAPLDGDRAVTPEGNAVPENAEPVPSVPLQGEEMAREDLPGKSAGDAEAFDDAWELPAAEEVSRYLFSSAPERSGEESGLSLEDEVRALRSENAELKQERDMLKKAAIHFSSLVK